MAFFLKIASAENSSVSLRPGLGRSSGLLTILLIIILVIAAFISTSLVVIKFQSHRALDDLNDQYLELWEKISNQVIYLYTRTEHNQLSPEVFQSLQTSIQSLMKQEQALKRTLEEKLASTNYQRALLGVTAAEQETMRAKLNTAFREQVREATEAPFALVRAGFATWDIATSVLLRSGRALDPIKARARLINQLQSRSIEIVWQILSIITVVVIAGILAIWARVLRPSIRDLELALSNAQSESQARAVVQSRLEERENEVRLLIDNIPGAVASFDSSARILSTNRAYRELYDIGSTENLLGKHINEIEDPQNWPKLSPHAQAVLSGEPVSFVEHLRFNGVFRHIQAAFVPGKDADGEIERFYALLIDVDEQQRMLQKLSRSEENLRITLNSIGDAVIATDAQSNVVRINPVAEVLTGWSASEAIGQPLERIFHVFDANTREPVRNPVSRVLKSQQIVSLAQYTLLVARNGIEYQISDSGAPIRDAAGDITGVVLVFRDVSQELALRQQLNHNEKMRAIGQLAGGIAHDFNNLLAEISGTAEMLAIDEEENISSKGVALINSLVASTQRAADLTEKLITFAGNADQSYRVHSVSRIVQNILQLGGHTLDKQIALSIDCTASQSSVYGSEGALHSAILNLVLNASQSMPNGGKISISCDNVLLNDAQCQSSTFNLNPGVYLEIRVADNGSGIHPDHLDKIFDPFFTTRISSRGTGLGLSTVYGTILDHQGAIYVDSTLHVGTEFRILLPCAKPVESAEEVKVIKSKPKLQGHVLLVDDEFQLLEIGSKMLETLGFDVITAENGQLALDIYQERGKDIALVILDMNMPVMNGHETLRKIKAINADCKVIISTGYSDSLELSKSRELGVADTLYKPYVLKQFSATVQKALQGDQVQAKRPDQSDYIETESVISKH